VFSNDVGECVARSAGSAASTMNCTNHVGKVGTAARGQHTVRALCGGATHEFRQGLALHGSRPLKALLQLRRKSKTLHNDSVSRTALDVIQSQLLRGNQRDGSAW